MREYSDVVIVGAGASGLLCGGLLAAEGIQVVILEKNAGCGKKLAATGNGRCNFTNKKMGAEFYYGDREWIEKALAQCGPDDVIRQFSEIGVLHRERDGYVYPHTNQSATVVEALCDFCRRGNAEILLECKAKGIVPLPAGNGYRVRTPSGDIRCRFVVLAAGGRAFGELGGTGSGYQLARSLGHSIHTLYPGLTGLVCGGSFWKRVAGTRIQGRFSLYIDDCLTESECGEIQIVKDGVSGIPVFQLCRVAARALAMGQRVEGAIDFVPPLSGQETSEWLDRHGMEGLVPAKWIPVLKNRPQTVKCLKEFRFPVEETFGIERAQVTAGGVSTDEVIPETMESKSAPGVFLTGELIDADGICGGYNLHLAWASAMSAARGLIEKIKGNEE